MKFCLSFSSWIVSTGFALAASVSDPIDLMTPRLPPKSSPTPFKQPTPFQSSPFSQPQPTPQPQAPAAPLTAKGAKIAPYDRLAKDNIRVEAHTLEAGSKAYAYWSTSWGTYGKSVYQNKLVEIHLSSIGNSGRPAIVELFRVLKVNGGRDTFVKSEGEDVKTDGQGTWCVRLSAHRSEIYSSSGRKVQTSGEKMVGIFVRVIRDNRIVGYSAAPSAYERYAEDPELMNSW